MNLFAYRWVAFFLSRFIILGKSRKFPKPLFSRRWMISYLEPTSGLLRKSRCAPRFIVYNHSLGRDCESKGYAPKPSLPSSTLQKSKNSQAVVLDQRRFCIRRIGNEREEGGIHASDAGRIPPCVYQWTRSFVRNNTAAIAAAAPGSDGTATAYPRKKISGPWVPSGRPAIWAAIMGEFFFSVFKRLLFWDNSGLFEELRIRNKKKLKIWFNIDNHIFIKVSCKEGRLIRLTRVQKLFLKILQLINFIYYVLLFYLYLQIIYDVRFFFFYCRTRLPGRRRCRLRACNYRNR